MCNLSCLAFDINRVGSFVPRHFLICSSPISKSHVRGRVSKAGTILVPYAYARSLINTLTRLTAPSIKSRTRPPVPDLPPICSIHPLTIMANQAALFPPLDKRPIANTICLFDVDGTLTIARGVCDLLLSLPTTQFLSLANTFFSSP